MAEERDRTGRCGWIALGFMAVLLQGLLPASFVGGVASAVAAESLLGNTGASELMLRSFVLMGMILALLVTAVVVMVLTLAVNTIAGRLFRPSCGATQSERLTSPF